MSLDYHTSFEARETLEALETVKHVSCGDCIGACCRGGMILPLTDVEARHLADNGTKLIRVSTALGFFRGRFGKSSGSSEYLLDEDCTFYNQQTNECEAFDSPERPRVCSDFPVGGEVCRSERMHEGVDTPGDYGDYLFATGQDSRKQIDDFVVSVQLRPRVAKPVTVALD